MERLLLCEVAKPLRYEARASVLLVTPDWPCPVTSGGRMRMTSLLRALKTCADVDVLCMPPAHDDAAAAATRAEGVTCNVILRPAPGFSGQWRRRLAMLARGDNLEWSGALQDAFNQRVAAADPRALWLETPYLLRYALPHQSRRALIVDYWGTAEGAQREVRLARGAHKLRAWCRWRAAYAGEARYAPLLRNIVTVSLRDADWFRRLAPGVRLWPVPIGMLDSLPAQEGKVREEEDVMLMTGDFSFRPNVDAAEYFVRAIFPRVRAARPAARIRFVGRAPEARVCALRSEPGVEVTGAVPSLNAALAAATVYVLPMRLGSGIRSKLLEVFPLAKPIVTTTVGAEGLDLVHERNCLVADTPDAFADACIRLLGDPTARRRLGEAAHATAQTHYTQEAIARKVREVVQAALTIEKA